jgi:hypothetical protein
MEHVTSDELRAALTEALRRLAPEGGPREIEFNAYCDCLLGLLADFLAARPETPEEIERLVALFRDKLASAMARRGCVGHA